MLLELRVGLADVVRKVLGFQEKDPNSPSKYWRKCIQSMEDIERWQNRLQEQVQRYSVTGQTMSTELSEVIDFQQQSLLLQHESLAVIAAQLVQANYTIPDDAIFLIARVRRLDRYDRISVHYCAILLTIIAQFGQNEEICSVEDARPINESLTSGTEADRWAMRNLHAAAVALWLAQYSGRFNDPVEENTAEQGRSKQFTTALDDGALHYALTLARDVTCTNWDDPAKTALVTFLLAESSLPTQDFAPPSSDVQELICTGLQGFTEAFITNMPDTIRLLSSAESDSRKTMRSRLQRGNQDSELHVERFLLLASYAYDKDSGAAMSFWSESDGNLYGFLQWAARRQTTPRVAAFCELLRSLSDDHVCADAVHRFLLDEGQPLGGRLRRTGPLSWSQILAELQFYATSSRDKLGAASALPTTGGPPASADEYVEPESAMMLECYLRLVSHVCEYSSTAREWILGHSDVQFHDLLLQLCSNSMESRLRACAFTTLRSLCSAGSRETATKLWSAIDAWIYGTLPSTAGLTKNLARLDPAGRHEHSIFKTISASLEESLAFVDLLHSLLLPTDAQIGLNDELPFPEGLGSTYRMPGIDAYVDFALGHIFAEQSRRVERIDDLRRLRLSCLRFAAVCLMTFNEDLVVIANRTGTGVENAMRTSSLATYVKLHPFPRVMEWMFTEKGVLALFGSAHENIEELNSAQAESPVVLAVLESIRVIISVLEQQPTYLDIVRPVVKTQPSSSRTPVGNAALPTFEDAILNNLQVIVDMGLYCGTSHQDLTVAALNLLRLISVSRKLSTSDVDGNGYRPDRSKMITVMETDDDADRVARGLAVELQVTARELEAGADAAGHIIKKRILEFVLDCLLANRDVPTIAHSLLGFKCLSNSVLVVEGGLFSRGESLFHAVARLAIEYPDCIEGTFVHWGSTIKALCMRILRSLWESPLTARLILDELRLLDFVFAAALQQQVIGPDTAWDGLAISDPDFLVNQSALGLAEFLQQRGAYLELLAQTVRSISPSEISSLRRRLESTILGVTQFADADSAPNASVFDLFDFMELDLRLSLVTPSHALIGDIDLSLCRPANSPQAPASLAGLEELLLLREADLQHKGQLVTQEAQAMAKFEGQALLEYIHGTNQHSEIQQAHRLTLKSWAQLLMVALECCSFEEVSRTTFSLQALQLLLPKLEKALYDDPFAAKELMSLAAALVRHIDLSDQSPGRTAPGGFIRDRLHQLFRTCLIGVGSLELDPSLRNLGYQVCYRYLQKAARSSPKKSAIAQSVLHAVKAAGSHLTDVVCDDAIAGQAECRVSATLLLAALVEQANDCSSKHLLQTFNKVNFVGALVDGIKTIPTALSQSSTAELPLVVVYYKALLSLLLRIANSANGAASVFGAGLFTAARLSLLFTIDPDIGIDMASDRAMKNFFDLSVALLQVINAVVLTRGPQNEQTIRQARDFLIDARPSMVGIFKRKSRIENGTSGAQAAKEDLTDLVDNWTLLVSLAGFLEVRGIRLCHLDGRC